MARLQPITLAVGVNLPLPGADLLRFPGAWETHFFHGLVGRIGCAVLCQ